MDRLDLMDRIERRATLSGIKGRKERATARGIKGANSA